MYARNLVPLVISVLLSLYSPSGLGSMPKHITSALKQDNIIENRIKVRAPDIAENGAVVGVSIDKILLHGTSMYVTKVWIFNDFRDEPVAVFTLGPGTRATNLATRLRLRSSSNVYFVARLSDGSMISGAKHVKVTIGGCGGGSAPARVSHSAPALNRLRLPARHWQNTERYAEISENGVVVCSEQPLSTFSIDVDTGSYSNVRRFIMREGRLPLHDAVRVEEMVNYFNYDYPVPRGRDTPFSVTTEIGPNPWNRHNHLLHIGLKGYEKQADRLPPANLVFLVDVSGSMRSTNKLGLLVASLKALVNQMRRQDSIAIVVYAGRTGVLLEPTPGDQRERILAVLDRLSAGGTTNGGAGIHLAYSMARQGFKQGGINRVLLATDGDFNVGIVDHNQLIDLIERQRDSGIGLTTLGFGTGNYNEKLMEQLADHGNGNYAYIDSYKEAKKVLVEQISGTLFTIAKDVKIQVEFNPAVVAEYRLIGYENRKLRAEDFRNDRVDAGDIGAGHTVTALYEVTFNDSQHRRIRPLRYSNNHRAGTSAGRHDDEIATVQLRYKLPDEASGREIQEIIQRRDVARRLSDTSDNFRFSAAVAAMGQWLRGGKMLNDMSLDTIKGLASDASQRDNKGYRREFINLVETSATL